MRAVLWLSLTAVSFGQGTEPRLTLRIAESGKTVKPASKGDEGLTSPALGENLTVEIDSTKPDSFFIRYRIHEGLVTPQEFTPACKPAGSTPCLPFKGRAGEPVSIGIPLAAPGTRGLPVWTLEYNIVERLNAAKLVESINEHQDAQSALRRYENPDLQKLTDDVKAANDLMDALKVRIDQLTALRGGTESLDELKRLQAEREKVRVDLADKQKKLSDLQKKAQKDKDALTKTRDEARAKLPSPLDQSDADLDALSRVAAEQDVYRVIAIGSVLIGSNAKVFEYGFRYGNRPQDLGLDPLSAAPVPTQFDRLYLHISNRLPHQSNETIVVKTSVAAGKLPNTEEWRPTQPFSALSLAAKLAPKAPEPVQFGANYAFRDEVFSIGGPFRGNDNVTVDVSTRVPQASTETSKEDSTATDTDPPKKTTTTTISRESKDVAILTAALPQVRALYRINFFTGVLFSPLKDPSFDRALLSSTPGTSTSTTTTVTNNTTSTTTNTGTNTTGTNTTNTVSTTTDSTTKTYFDRTTPGGVRVIPIVGFGFNIWRVDPQKKWSPKELLNPSYSIAFGVDKPGDDIFAGANFEVIRNVHLFAGAHWGKLNTLRPRPFSDPTDASPPTIDRAWQSSPKFTGGITLNVDALAKIFNIKLP